MKRRPSTPISISSRRSPSWPACRSLRRTGSAGAWCPCCAIRRRACRIPSFSPMTTCSACRPALPAPTCARCGSEDWTYAVYFGIDGSGIEYELYDLATDPLQLKNLLHELATGGRAIRLGAVTPRADAEACRGCQPPGELSLANCSGRLNTSGRTARGDGPLPGRPHARQH